MPHVALADSLAGVELHVLPHVGQIGRHQGEVARAPSSRAVGAAISSAASLALGCCRPRNITTRGGSGLGRVRRYSPSGKLWLVIGAQAQPSSRRQRLASAASSAKCRTRLKRNLPGACGRCWRIMRRTLHARPGRSRRAGARPAHAGRRVRWPCAGNTVQLHHQALSPHASSHRLCTSVVSPTHSAAGLTAWLGIGIAQRHRLHRRGGGDGGLQQVGVKGQQRVAVARGAFGEHRHRVAACSACAIWCTTRSASRRFSRSMYSVPAAVHQAVDAAASAARRPWTRSGPGAHGVHGHDVQPRDVLATTSLAPG
jgi:hypothetical protein